MTLTGCLLWLFPAAKDLVTVNGRLSGFLQYPNTFAAFLLTGIAVLGAKSRPKATDYLTGAVLIAGLFLSGSRTGVLLLALLLPTIGVVHKKISPAVLIVSAAAAKTDPLAHRTGNSTDLERPHNYKKLLDALAEANLPATS